ncbi:cysteine-rich CWC family protein [Dysgonomonas macrotermitis]|uniref:Cysteine-rich CWC n=1 Tax=Dysgonomonas macrotermitis TaxID=1346286 RepID=A0A1M5BIQ7_9BACT|nr:cysteine-rich CWC family protein [Dysgonomonas macrotermitis]SHF42289.1 Cysteine-rich CWC [Dysgonomonas macrotermitis]
MKKICPRCSNSFVCREDRTDLCSCTRVYLISGVRDYVKENYESCLCPSCLKETSASFHSFGVNPKYLTNNR